PRVMFNATPMSGSFIRGHARLGHRIDDLYVARAPAQVAFDRALQVGGFAAPVLLRHAVRLHHDARRAESTLHGAVLSEACPERLADWARGTSLDGHQLAPVAVCCKHQARIDRATIHTDGAGAALAVAAG